jgi:hypothetical protein
MWTNYSHNEKKAEESAIGVTNVKRPPCRLGLVEKDEHPLQAEIMSSIKADESSSNP